MKNFTSFTQVLNWGREWARLKVCNRDVTSYNELRTLTYQILSLLSWVLRELEKVMGVLRVFWVIKFNESTWRWKVHTSNAWFIWDWNERILKGEKAIITRIWVKLDSKWRIFKSRGNVWGNSNSAKVINTDSYEHREYEILYYILNSTS